MPYNKAVKGTVKMDTANLILLTTKYPQNHSTHTNLKKIIKGHHEIKQGKMVNKKIRRSGRSKEKRWA